MEKTVADSLERALRHADREWRDTCRLLLGEDIGGIERYSAYLTKEVPATKATFSYSNGHELAVAPGFCGMARFVSQGEAEIYSESLSNSTMDVNEIKDIDSLFEAAHERAFFAGSVSLGKKGVSALSNAVVDSDGVYRSSDVFESSSIAYCRLVRYSRNNFGSACISKAAFGIRNFETYEVERLFETLRTYNSSDCYFAANLEGCHSCMFCFNLRNRRNCVGNLELPPGKFMAVKAKLVEDIRETLRSRGQMDSIFELVGGKDDEKAY